MDGLDEVDEYRGVEREGSSEEDNGSDCGCACITIGSAVRSMSCISMCG
jgi:hypothetical protein